MVRRDHRLDCGRARENISLFDTWTLVNDAVCIGTTPWA